MDVRRSAAGVAPPPSRGTVAREAILAAVSGFVISQRKGSTGLGMVGRSRLTSWLASSSG